MKLRVCALYPDHMNIYADRGNLILLERRCAWRGIGFELIRSEPGEPIDAGAADLFYVGGGQDRDQRLVAEDMRKTKRRGLESAVEDGAVLLAVCGGYQLLGHGYVLGGERIEGLGLTDLETVREPGPRLIGNVAIQCEIEGEQRVLAGFENHGGRTRLGSGATPLGRVLDGFGNDGADGTEGVRRLNIFGTYLHGPLLPKNAWFADYLTALALERAEGSRPPLSPLDDALEDATHEQARAAAASGGRG